MKFEEIISALQDGKRIKRKSWYNPILQYSFSIGFHVGILDGYYGFHNGTYSWHSYKLIYDDLIADDWEIAGN